MLQCRLVHAAKDQCAFVRLNCPDEEAGLFSYLQLYYCRLSDAKPFAFLILVVWLGLLFSTIGIAASDFFCINLSTIATVLGMSESMAGVTFLAFGNGSPDVFSTFAAMKTHSGSLAVGELIGAASFITAVVAGSMALVRPFKVARKSFVRDIGFFIIAASFSMVFLADGNLHLWECIVMVVFYVFYVITVVIWHWYLRKRWQQRALEDTARSHFHLPGIDEGQPEPYHDEEEEGTTASRSRATTRTVSIEDFANLERDGSPVPRAIVEEIDANDETRDRYLAEISSNMRVSRPGPGERRNTVNPIRPSLVGALEFRAVLSSLQKSKNFQTIPINLRRYSDDPTFTTAQQQDNLSVVSDPEISHQDIDAHDIAFDSYRPSLEADRTVPHRVRAVSANDALGLRLNQDVLRKPRLENPQIDLASSSLPPGASAGANNGQHIKSPRLTIPSSAHDQDSLFASPLAMSPAISPQEHQPSGDFLAPPGNLSASQDRSDDVLPSRGSPRVHANASRPKIQIPHLSKSAQGLSPLSTFPPYFDDPNIVPSSSRAPSIRLPPPSIGSESTYHQHIFQEPEEKPMRWWPYQILPPPKVMVSTLFPTLYAWKDKSLWEKMLGLVAAPSVFLLAITLPIVEVEKEGDEGLSGTVNPDPGLLSPKKNGSQRNSLVPLSSESPHNFLSNEADATRPNMLKHSHNGLESPSINVTAPQSDGDSHQKLPRSKSSQRPQQSSSPTQNPPSSPKDWNRWLVATQLFTAPWFIVLIVWANTTPSSPRALLLPTIYSLIASLIVLSLLLLLTSPEKPPRFRHLICYLGFVVAIAWISTIANEVVGVLKALGIILDISDAILGLTVFAVGNSLGDLVADITVARLGYPVMALSACFGGPMLNILLGIGLGGCYMTIRGAEKRVHKHPERPMKYKPYQIEIGSTLLISGITLLVTLAGLVIVVPLRGWWMDRRVGWGLVVLWTASTVGNVVVEIMGWGREFR